MSWLLRPSVFLIAIFFPGERQWMRVLALEAYYGGSHQAFLDGWRQRSRHDWELFTLPDYKWKWRMRHASITFAQWVGARVLAGAAWDVVFCSDMMSLAEFRGLAPAPVARLPHVLYFHENQLTYPDTDRQVRDYHFGFTNLTSALAADAVWFNSAYHCESLLEAWQVFLARMPDFAPLEAVQRIQEKTLVQWPGIDPLANNAGGAQTKSAAAESAGGVRRPRPLRIVWAARWELDKNPLDFLAALRRLRDWGVPFRVSVLGSSPAPDAARPGRSLVEGTAGGGPDREPVSARRELAAAYAAARAEFGRDVEHWGYVADRDAYLAKLAWADVIVSTARHEFFGLAVAEAMEAGVVPLLPDRLAYPELLQVARRPVLLSCLYDGTVGQLAERLAAWAARVGTAEDLLPGLRYHVREVAANYHWEVRAATLDDQLQRAAEAAG